FNGWSVPLAISILLALIGAIIGTMAGRNCTIK
ncbi:MAG: EamA family transporter, partial [Alcaligenaceae bacterium]|nr:EamA family transporter [Alcaligenaceae bacterium]